MMTMPARQLVAKSLPFMIHTLFSVRAPRRTYTLCTNPFAPKTEEEYQAKLDARQAR